MISNRPLPDRLFTVRDRIRKLKVREEELKAALVANEATREGLEYDVVIKPMSFRTLDRAKVKLKYPKVYEECQKVTSYPMVNLKKKEPNSDGQW